MSELPFSNSSETNEHKMSPEELAEVQADLGAEAAELTVQIGTAEVFSDENSEKIGSSETVGMIDNYKTEHGSVRGLYMKDLVEKGFDPDTILQKLGNERLEENLDIESSPYGIKRGSEQWKKFEEERARSIPMTDNDIDSLLEAGANPQLVVDALQRTEPQDGVDNDSSARIAARIDKLVEAGLPPSILAARLSPSWREASKDKLADSEVKWCEANRLKAVA